MAEKFPQLVFYEWARPSGYAPRAIQLSAEHENVLFVGCKDGSVTKVERGEPTFLVEPMRSAAAVRSICEWDARRILVARNNGHLEVIRSEDGGREWQLDLGDGGPLLTVARIDRNRVLVSSRKCGCQILEQDGTGDPKFGERLEFVDSDGEGESAIESQAIRFAAPLVDMKVVEEGGEEVVEKEAKRCLLISEQGDLFSWDEKSNKVKPAEAAKWSTGERQAAVNDIGLWRADKARKYHDPAWGAFIATDTGIYLATVKRAQIRICRLAMSGLGSICTALSYTEDEEFRYLWAADLSGDCHLFWDKRRRGEEAEYLDFRRTGLVHADSQVLVCFAWIGKGEGTDGAPETLFFGQARRDDRIVVGEYVALDQTAGAPDLERGLTEAEVILIEGDSGKVSAYLQKLDAEREGFDSRAKDLEWRKWDDKPARLAELFERFSADPGRRKVLLESLLGQSAAENLLKDLAENGSNGGGGADEESGFEDLTKDVERALQTWTLSLLGSIHRHPVARERDAAYLALLRWLRNRQQNLLSLLEEDRWSGERKAKLGGTVEASVRFARKWGVYSEANAWRENLVLPLRRLNRDSPSGAERLDGLTYQVLLYQRQVSSQEVSVEAPMRGRTAWSTATLEREGGLELAAVSWVWGGIQIYEPNPEQSAKAAPVRPTWVVRTPEEKDGKGTSTVPTLVAVRNDGDRDGPRMINRDAEGQSRAIHLGRVGGVPYLLAAPARDPSEPGPEKLCLWRLRSSNERWERERKPDKTVAVKPGDESVHSLVEVAEGWLVVGLRGSGQAGRIGLIEIRADGGVLKPYWRGAVRLKRGGDDQTEEKEGIGGVASSGGGEARGGAASDDVPAEQAETNRAWSLAAGRSECEEGESISVFVGCERGEIFGLSLTWDGEAWALPVSGVEEGRARMVARLSSSVRALAYRETDEGLKRLYAGGEDGTIGAWQETDLPAERERGSKGGAGREKRFVSLWATVEPGAVSAIHLLDGVELDRGRYEQEGDEGGRAVLAVTREGRAVLLDDREQAARPKELKEGPEDAEEEPTRIPLPGSRHGRPWLRGSCFTSVVLRRASGVPEEGDSADFKPTVELLVGSGEGTVRLVGIHDPAITTSRNQRYKAILEEWWKVVLEEQQLRLGSALYRTSPAVEQILVRWLLDPSYPSKEDRTRRQEDENGESYQPKSFSVPTEKESWWLPRHLRPLRALRAEWEALFPASTTEELDPGEVSRRCEAAGLAFELALRRAWQYDDLELFQETCEVVLKRANFLVYDRIRRKNLFGFVENGDCQRWDAEKRKIQKLYDELVGAMERTVQRWLGAGEGKEARAHMAIAKQLVDGDTFWQLLREVESEKRGSNGQRPRREPPTDGPCTAVLERRVRNVSVLVFKRDPLVNLEALRAANLSLFRLCMRLCGEPVRDENGTWPGRGEVEWRIFEPYVRHLVGAAVRAFGSHVELGDALAHEYSRTFALAICACPSATIRIANLMAEKLLISDPDSEDDFSHRVRHQIWLLGDLGLEYPKEVPVLFEAVAWPERGEVNPVRQVRKGLRRLEASKRVVSEGEVSERELSERIDQGSWERLGRQNAEDLDCMEGLYGGVVEWLEVLEGKLASDARAINLTGSKEDEIEGLDGLDAQCDELDNIDQQNLYGHSRRFWRGRVGALKTKLGLEDGGQEDGERAKVRGVSKEIRPEVVLASGTLAEWARESLNDLDRRYQELQIFQPEYRHFREVLLRFERVAGAFHKSAAVHKNLVEGVLGHHLLEDLDEHVLELIEIAHVLDPLKVQEYLASGRRGSVGNSARPATAESFAAYLVGRSRNAESIPKNLRTLQSLLTSTGSPGLPETLEKLVEELVADEVDGAGEGKARWKVPKHPRVKIDDREARFLGLVIRELDHNDREYGPVERERKEDPSIRPEMFAKPHGKDGQGGGRVKVRFRVREELCGGDGDEDAMKRLEELQKENRLQEPFPPWRRRSFASHGTGLYLANLAAAVVGWRLSIEHVSRKEQSVTFLLEKVGERGSAGTGEESG